MSLYYHLPGKEGLLDGLAETVVAEIDAAARAPSRPGRTGDWRTQLRRRFLAAREVMLRHPWAPGLLGSRPSIPVGRVRLLRRRSWPPWSAAGSPTGSRTGRCTRSAAWRSASPRRSSAPPSAGGSIDVDVAEAELAAMAEALPHLTAMVAAEVARRRPTRRSAGATARSSSSSPSISCSTDWTASAARVSAGRSSARVPRRCPPRPRPRTPASAGRPGRPRRHRSRSSHRRSRTVPTPGRR